METIDKVRKDLEDRLIELTPCLEEAARIQRLLRVMNEAEVEQASTSLERIHVSSETRRLQILAILRDAEGPVRVKDLAEALVISSGRVSQLVTRLVDAGHAKRGANGVQITSAGLDLVPPELNFRPAQWQMVDIDE